MKSEQVLAVIVSYNGVGKITRGIDALRNQVDHIHVVDNGSGPETLRLLDTIEGGNVTVERLSENRGVGYALNRGVHFAQELKYQWLLTMDQDSIVSEGFIEAYRVAVEHDPSRVCLTPRLAKYDGLTVEPVGYAITSGNLVKMTLYEQIGAYDESFFIDGIDFDFCLRVRNAGYSIYRVGEAYMQHQLGEPVTPPRFFGKFYAQHSPGRRYYMYRNFLYLARRFVSAFPLFVLKLGISHLILLVLVGFMDPNPLAGYRAIGRGILDYFKRKQGRSIRYAL